jgi:tRNA pseudouridine38-40 synthase
MPRLRLTLEYDGTDFRGWQVQPRCRTVQGTVEEVLAGLTGRRIRVHGSGRTDAGVHALGQVAHLDVEESEVERVASGLEPLLPRDVGVLEVEPAPPGFDARRDAVERLYKYRILRRRRPLLDRYAHVHRRPLDTGAMRRAAAVCRGVSGWRGMAKEGSGNTDWMVKVMTSLVAEDALGWTFLISANRFLRGMVRLWAGTLLQVGAGRLAPADVRGILDTGERDGAGPALPAGGLTLVEVRYYDGRGGGGQA